MQIAFRLSILQGVALKTLSPPTKKIPDKPE
jgi:hypothetical protein